MRKMVLAFVTALMASLTAPAMAQSWSPSLFTFTQGQTYTRYFEHSGLENFEAAQIEIWYPDSVFEPISLLPGASEVTIGSAADAGNLLITVSPTILSFPSATDPYSINLSPGAFFGVQFKVHDNAVPGDYQVRLEYVIDLSDPLTGESLEHSPLFAPVSFSATIAAIPEPETWAMMVAGIALVGFAARARRSRA